MYMYITSSHYTLHIHTIIFIKLTLIKLEIKEKITLGMSGVSAAKRMC